jgi:mRNA-degrading endonuclease RelE of RelBE toxin-antitoxin system
MNWNVYFSRKAGKQAKKLNQKLTSILDLLIEDLRHNGAFPGKHWPNYSKLLGQKTDIRHCHLIKGKPTYVCCWEIIDKQLKLIEVSYVGSHEKAPY